jgi:ABC-type bacteriocin/lantibiotic exporter with double-glycine peptidase domain
LTYNNPDATLEDVMRVAEKCQINQKIINMPDGYNTNVGDLGNLLSGGEK